MGDIIFGNSNGGGGGSSGVQTLNNGLTLTGTNGQLGGPLVQATNVNLNGQSYSLTDSNVTFAFSGTGLSVATSNGAAIHGNLGVSPGVFNLFASNGSAVQQINATLASTGIKVTDSSALFGMVYAADYSAAGSANSLWIPNLGYIQSLLGGFPLTAHVKDTGLSSNQTILTYAVPVGTASQYQVNASITDKAATGGSSATLVLGYTNSNGLAQTVTLCSATVAAGGSGQALSLNVAVGSTITVSLVITVSGNFDCFAALTFIN